MSYSEAMAKRWHTEDKEEYKYILSQEPKVVLVSDKERTHAFLAGIAGNLIRDLSDIDFKEATIKL